MLRADTVEVQAEERDGPLFRAPHRWGLGRIPGDHAEIVREDGSRPRLVGKEVVGNGTTIHELKGAIRVLEVQLREPIRRVVLCDTRRGAL